MKRTDKFLIKKPVDLSIEVSDTSASTPSSQSKQGSASLSLSDRLRSGVSLEDFPVQDFLGYGNSKKVFSAAATDSIQPSFAFSTHIFREDEHDDPRFRKFVTELEINDYARGIKNVARFHGAQVVEHGDFFSCSPIHSFCRDGNLKAFLEKNRLTSHQIKRIAFEQCSALIELHTRGIVHRDIKPENILIHEGMSYLSDFGEGCHSHCAAEDAFQLRGSLQYQHPDLHRQEKIPSRGFDHAAQRFDFYRKQDFWALGSTLLFLLERDYAPWQLDVMQEGEHAEWACTLDHIGQLEIHKELKKHLDQIEDSGTRIQLRRLLSSLLKYNSDHYRFEEIQNACAELSRAVPSQIHFYPL